MGKLAENWRKSFQDQKSITRSKKTRVQTQTEKKFHNGQVKDDGRLVFWLKHKTQNGVYSWFC